MQIDLKFNVEMMEKLVMVFILIAFMVTSHLAIANKRPFHSVLAPVGMAN